MSHKSSLSVTHSAGEYPIIIGENLFADETLLRSFVRGTQVLIVTDDQVAPHYLSHIQTVFSVFHCDTVILQAGEASKTLQTFEKILDVCASQQHHRDTTLIALGGGVVGDITGFVAACYHRGVAWLQMPTTLLSQVDASIGGKTAVNHAMGKNLIGAYHPPSAVIIDINTVNTLPEKEYRAGFSEILKAALIADASFFEWLEENVHLLLARDKKALQSAIQKSCAIKAHIVMLDEKEKRLRMTLNLGHTFGHAIEKMLGFEWTHGEAVAYGICVAATLSSQLGLLHSNACDRIHRCFTAFRLLQPLPKTITFRDLTHTMQSDKKVTNNRLQLILLSSIGKVVISEDISTDSIMTAWHHFGDRLQ